MPGRKTTRTSAFGSPGRVAHDSRRFYAGKLYQDAASETRSDYVENQVPAKMLDRILCLSSEHMEQVPEASVHLVVTSPPYNVGKDYDQDLNLEEYLHFLLKVWRECLRVLVPGGRLCINIANLGRKPYIPLHALLIPTVLDLGYLMRGEIIWDKGASASPSTAWGSWRSASNATLRDIHEYILVFSKQRFKRDNPSERESSISRDEFLEFTKSVWDFPAEPARKVGHPAPFPVELPRRLIELYTFKDEVVLDPFMGSGQTALAALQAGRHFIGYEISEKYVELANKRIADHINGQQAEEK